MKTKVLSRNLKLALGSVAIVALLVASVATVSAASRAKGTTRSVNVTAMVPAMEATDKATEAAKEAAHMEAQAASVLADQQAALQRDAKGATHRPSRVPQLLGVTCGAGAIRVESDGLPGNDADYATLAAAFAAINAGSHTGAIGVGVCADTAEGATSAVLNASGTGSASYTSVLMTPAGARTITGATTAGLPLIDLNGADFVTIDGLNSAGNSLTISNTTVSATAGTSTVRLINGAESNTLTNCTVLGSSTSSTATAGGNVLISTSTGGTNSGNTVSNNNIGPAGANLPTKGVLSLGSASPNNNTGNIIDNNNVFDFFSATVSGAGIVLQANTATTTVSNNRIYQTAPRTFTTTALSYSGILMTSSGNANTITGNKVGFGAANGTGTTSISGSTNLFRGLNLTSGSTTTATSVQGNTVSGIVHSTASTGTGSGSAFHGIFLGGARYDVGTVTGNTIGSLDGSSTITFTQSSTGTFNGIHDFTSSSNTISNNNIGAITINGTGLGTGGFRGIVTNTLSSQLNTVNNNRIGASGAGAITDSLVGGYAMYGIHNPAGVLVANGNTIQNMSGNSNGAGLIISSGLISTATTSTAGGPHLISQNVIHSLSNNSGAANNSIYALYCSFPGTTANVVERNFVHSLSITSTNTAAQLVGILPVAGTGTYKNNMVRLGLDASGASITTGLQIYGMFQIAGLSNIYFNSVYVGGTGVSDAQSTFAFVSNVASGARSYIDNIFWNARSNGAGTGGHFAIALSGPGFTSNYNDLYADGTGGFVGSFGGTHLTLADWQTATGQDANSKSVDPLFVNPTGTAATVDLHLMGGSPCIAMATQVAGITNDFDNDTRHPCTPDIGADELTPYAGPAIAVVTISKTADAASVSYGSQAGFVVKLTNTTASTATGLLVSDNLPPAPGINWTIDAGATDAGWSVVGTPPTQTLEYSPSTLAGSTMTQAHVVSATTAATCGSTLNNTASYSITNGCPGAGSGMASASVSVLGLPMGVFSENFDGVTPPALPAGWAAANASGPAPLWVTSNAGVPTPVADTLPNAAFIDNPAVVSDKRLDSPSIAIATGAAQLTFRHNYTFEASTLPNTWDGGVLEISIGGGAFADIVTAGGSFVAGGYTATVNAGFSNPIPGRAAWGNTSGGFITTTVNLPAAAAGQSIVLRWRIGTDNSGAGSGWRVDSVAISEPGACPGPPLTADSALSRKNHTGVGDFDINLPLAGSAGIECRSGGGTNDYQVIITFSNNVVSGSASVTAGTGNISGSPTFSTNTMTINLTGVTDVQQITVTASNVMDVFAQTLASTAVPMKVLIGDTNNSSGVTGSDITQTKAAASVGTVNGSTFRTDVNVSGSITGSDIVLVKSKSGNTIP